MPRKRPVNYAKGTRIPFTESQRRIECHVNDRIPGADRYRLYHEQPPNAPYERYVHRWEQLNARGGYDTVSWDCPRIDKRGRRLSEQEYDESYRTTERLIYLTISQVERGIASPAVVFYMHTVNPTTGKTPFQVLMEEHVLKLPSPSEAA